MSILEHEYDYLAWNPSKEQFDRYAEREVQMALVKLRRREPCILHSDVTVRAAKALLATERKRAA